MANDQQFCHQIFSPRSVGVHPRSGKLVGAAPWGDADDERWSGARDVRHGAHLHPGRRSPQRDSALGERAAPPPTPVVGGGFTFH